MGAVLVILALIAAILWLFTALFRSKVRARLREVPLPEELRQFQPSARAVPAAAAARTGGAVPAARPPAPAARPLPQGGPHFVLVYQVGPDFIQKREQFRAEHLALAWQAATRGELLLAGALEAPTEQALLLFRGSREAALRFAEGDPYVRQGLVRAWRVQQWHTVVGDAAADPVRPAAVRSP